MTTLYDWLKEKKEQGKGYRKVTLVYYNGWLEHKKAYIKPKPYGYSGHYMKTLMNEKEPEYYEIDNLLCFIEEEFLRDYYVTYEGLIKDLEYHIAYKLEVTDSKEAGKDKLDVRIKASNFHDDPVLISDDFRMILNGSWDSKKPLEIKKLIVDGPATIIFWSDGTKTVVKCDKDDIPDHEKGILYAALKKLSNKKEYNDILRAIDTWEATHKNKNLCDSCGNKECIFQSGIVRKRCDFYMSESEN